MTPRTKIPIVVMAASVAISFGQTTPATKPDADNHRSLATSVQEIVGGKPGATDFLAPLAAALAKVRSNPDGAGPELDKLVDALNSNADLERFYGDFADSAVAHDLQFKFRSSPTWKYGTESAISDLSRRLYAKAKDLRRDNAKRASQYARAAIEIASLRASHIVVGGVQVLFSDRDELGAVADLRPAQLDAIHAVVTELDRHERACNAQLVVATKDQDSLIKWVKWQSSPDPPTFEEGLKALSTGWPEAAGQRSLIGRRFELIQLASEYLSICRFTKDDIHAGEIESLIKSWGAGDSEPFDAKWIADALHAPGTLPETHLARMPTSQPLGE